MKRVLFTIIISMSTFSFMYSMAITILAYDNLRNEFIFENFHNFLIILLTLILSYLLMIDYTQKYKKYNEGRAKK